MIANRELSMNRGPWRVLLTIAAILVSLLLLALPELLEEYEHSSRYTPARAGVTTRSTARALRPVISFTPPPTLRFQGPVAVGPAGPSMPSIVDAPVGGSPSGMRQVVGIAIERPIGGQEPERVAKRVVHSGDTLRAGPNSIIELQFIDGSSVLLEPSSVLQIVSLSLDEGVGDLYQSTGEVRMFVRSLLSWHLKADSVTLSPRVGQTEFAVEVEHNVVHATVPRGMIVAHRQSQSVAVEAGQLLVAYAGGRMTVGAAGTPNASRTPTFLSLPTFTATPGPSPTAIEE